MESKLRRFIYVVCYTVIIGVICVQFAVIDGCEEGARIIINEVDTTKGNAHGLRKQIEELKAELAECEDDDE